MEHALRPATDADAAFLLRLYSSTRAEEVAATRWDETQQRAFLAMQFQAQHQYYHQQFPDAQYAVVMVEGQAVGRWYVQRDSQVLRVLDIALLPEWRGRGLGGELMADLLAEAERGGKAVELHVECNNPALQWYQRLGFQEVEDAGIYRRMRWTAPAPARASELGQPAAVA